MIAVRGELAVIARLRESHALELQQKLLSSLGRVGLMAQMPATFPVRVEAGVPDMTGAVLPLNPQVEALNGVCYVGRPGERDMRLILPEDACEAICAALASLDMERVHVQARDAVTRLRESGDLLLALEKGITLHGRGQRDVKEFYWPPRRLKDQPLGKSMGWIGWDYGEGGRTLGGPNIKRSGIVLSVRLVGQVGEGLSWVP
jgi:hypothetical protein